jgi:sterol desaturase/sphingolipid hydroxylase (fatty acid hydroxylase superfamily)
VFHWLPWLWRLHAVHHSDTSFDVTTGVRFHIGEVLVSFALKTLVVLALGASIWSVIAFETLLSSASLFTHSNVRFSTGTDAALRSIVVTPDVHLVHHSVECDEHNCNFGFLLIWWDRLFGSYRTMPRGDPQSMPIGLSDFRDDGAQRLGALLIQPFSPPHT